MVGHEELRNLPSAALVQRLGPSYAFDAGHLSRVIKDKLGFTMQARRALARERNSAVSDMYGQQFLMRMLRYGPHIAWFDASGVNSKTGMRTRGWAWCPRTAARRPGCRWREIRAIITSLAWIGRITQRSCCCNG